MTSTDIAADRAKIEWNRQRSHCSDDTHRWSIALDEVERLQYRVKVLVDALCEGGRLAERANLRGDGDSAIRRAFIEQARAALEERT